MNKLVPNAPGWWWYEDVNGKQIPVEVVEFGGQLCYPVTDASPADNYPASIEYFGIGRRFRRWLGPVNPEPLPWPAE